MKQFIAKIIKKALKKHPIKEKEIEKLIEVPPTIEMGDYAFPCFVLSKVLKQNPHQIALELRADIGNPPKEFESIETKGPYVNFFINREQLSQSTITQILKEGDNFGSSNLGNDKKVLIEHTSINPNASPHVGRARNAIIGDSLVRIFKFLNFKTDVHYYVNDVSKQIAMLVLAKADKLKFEGMLKKYMQISKKIAKSKKLEREVFDLLNRFENGDKEVIGRFKKITNTCVRGQEKILSELGIKYDSFDYESKYLEDSKWIITQLQKTGKLHKDKEGRLVLNQKGTQVEKKMKAPILVLTRSDGTGLYPLRDISYTMEKMKSAKKNIIVLGEDQKLYFEQISEALKLLNVPSPEVVHYSYILLKEKDKSKKMSTRKGDVALLEDFLKDAINKAKKEISKRKSKTSKDASEIVGVGAVKYSILKNNPNKMILFNLDDALNFEGDTGPYMQYSYARASSILRKAKSKKKNPHQKNELEEKEIELIKKLSEFPEVVLKSYKNLNPSHIANYSYRLSKIFNEFYHSSKVIGSEKEEFRLKLVGAFRQVLKNSLSLLGIEVIEVM